MNKVMILLAMGVFVAGGSVMTTGCGDDTSDGDADADTDADSDMDADSDSDTGSGNCPDGSFDAASTCAEYCTCMAANCPDVTFTTDCETTCGELDQGEVCDQDGASVECRHYHCTAAATDAATHCPHAEGLQVCSP